jgi:hypothetical protein
MKGGFEQLPNYIKGIGKPCCTPDLFRLVAERRALAAEPSSISENPSIGDSPNPLPQHRIRSARSDIGQPLASFHSGVCFWNRTRARGVGQAGRLPMSPQPGSSDYETPVSPTGVSSFLAPSRAIAC